MSVNQDHSADRLNLILILIALYVSFQLPYQLFLIAYAVLGPLHYLTEINWVRNKGYFMISGTWIWIALICALLISAPRWINLSNLEDAEWVLFATVFQLLETYSSSFLIAALGLAITAQITQKIEAWVAIPIITFTISAALTKIPLYALTIGLLLPTLIHVYAFTLFFMLSGALKSHSIVGYANVSLMILIPFVIGFVETNPSAYLLPEGMKRAYLDAEFHVTTVKLNSMLGLSDTGSFYFLEKSEWKMQIFITFAYTYHYLNWFTKTSIIRWHESLSLSRSMLIGVLWLISIGLFWFDYRTGFLSLIGLSFLHVILEFPLNIRSIKSVARHLKYKP